MRADLVRLKRDSESLAVGGQRPRRQRSRRGIESLAVLPLVNASADPDAEYLSDGISANLINSFSQLQRLRVAHQQKSFRYRGGDVDLQQVARELNVHAILRVAS